MHQSQTVRSVHPPHSITKVVQERCYAKSTAVVTMRKTRSLTPVLLCLQIGWFVAVVHGATCREQLLSTLTPGLEYLADWIDQDTPDAACTKQLCTNSQFSVCNPASSSVPTESMVLVFSDEFNEDGRKFGAADKDPRWTAMDMYYFPTREETIYKPDQVTTKDGAAVITIDKKSSVGVTQQPNGDKLKWAKDYTSGFMEGWNKFCYTGGYLEASVQLPGDSFYSGFWPALWTMGNLGRAGYMQSTTGFWPYSYNTCGQGSEGQPWSLNAPQLLSACPDADGFNRSMYGMAPGVGRGAPEFDVFEVSVNANNDGTPSNPGASYQDPHVSHTLQMAPLLPQGVHWLDEAFYAAQGIQNGVFFPGYNTQYKTNYNTWWGSLSSAGLPPRPGNEYQDSISALSYINKSFYTSFHKFGVDWKPGEYLRWYIDDQFVYEVNKNALLARTNSSGASVGQRLIPMEAVYIILNLGMSEDFGRVDYDNLAFPSQMLVDYIRVYQSRGSINVGCSPVGFPTSQYIACNKDKYTAVKGDDAMISEKCTSGAAHGMRLAGRLCLAGALTLSLLIAVGLISFL